MEQKRMRGDNPHIVHIDESGFLDEAGKPIYVGTDGKRYDWPTTVEGKVEPECEFHGADKPACEQHGCTATDRLAAAEQRHHQAYASEEERAADAARIRAAVSMPGDRRNDPRVIAHKKGVVRAHQKIVRKQLKQEKLKALQAKAFTNGK